MIRGAHVILFTEAADETRDFLGRALHLDAVDAGGGWRIFALPPAEVAVHPASAESHELYLMCDDLPGTIAELEAAGATFGPVHDERWGRATVMTMPGGTQAVDLRAVTPEPGARGVAGGPCRPRLS